MEYNEEIITEKRAIQERQWFATNCNIEPQPEFSDMTFQVELNASSEIVLFRVCEVMKLILDVPKNQWLSEIDWRMRFPEWFLAVTPSYTPEELAALLETTPKEKWHLLPSEYSSWLRGMKCRGWRWSGYTIQQNMLTVHIVIDDSPVYEGTIEHLLRAAGAKNVIVTFHHR